MLQSRDLHHQTQHKSQKISARLPSNPTRDQSPISRSIQVITRVSWRRKKSPFCGLGSLIGERIWVSAALCLRGSAAPSGSRRSYEEHLAAAVASFYGATFKLGHFLKWATAFVCARHQAPKTTPANIHRLSHHSGSLFLQLHFLLTITATGGGHESTRKFNFKLIKLCKRGMRLHRSRKDEANQFLIVSSDCSVWKNWIKVCCGFGPEERDLERAGALLGSRQVCRAVRAGLLATTANKMNLEAEKWSHRAGVGGRRTVAGGNVIHPSVWAKWLDGLSSAPYSSILTLISLFVSSFPGQRT